MSADRSRTAARPAARGGPAFVPLGPDELARRLARWIDRVGPSRVRIGIDGDETVGAADLADAISGALLDLGRPAIRVSTRWWWRAASLRLEHGRRDVESRLSGWVDAGALSREVVDPLHPAGSGRYLTRLRDPDRDRAVREAYRQAPDGAVLLLDGPMLATHALDLDQRLKVGVSQGRLRRVLPDDRQWEVEAFAAYDRGWDEPEVVLSYDHPATPAVRGLPR
ncbi:uridine kinase [Nakamurella deserti]|uniref:uridine kinase n=1 Tax=Nakamurella deserti TaxID=2164074 RepID=UPI000DBE83AB|nr:uridine kinase [Nakamurella deserti]